MGARTELACLNSAMADLWANHAMLALIEQAERRHAEYLAKYYPTMCNIKGDNATPAIPAIGM